MSGGRSPHSNLFDEWEMTLARAAVAKFKVKYPWLHFPESEDLLQECLTQWYVARSRFRQNNGTSARTYMSRVVSLRLQAILREELAYKRRINHMACSLDEPLYVSGETLADAVADEKALSDPATLVDLRAAVEGLTLLQQCICHLLGQGYTIKSITKALGIPKKTVRDQIKRIREAFIKRGLTLH